MKNYLLSAIIASIALWHSISARAAEITLIGPGGIRAAATELVAAFEKATGHKQPPCWCTNASFSEQLLARMPQEAGNKACVCTACAASFLPA